MRIANLSTRRSIFEFMLIAPFLIACHSREPQVIELEPTGRFQGTGRPEIVVDAVEGQEYEGVEFFDDRGTAVFGSSVISKNVRKGMGYASPHIPEYIRVVWRKNPSAKLGGGQAGDISYEGPIAGDYIVPVGPRIPDAVLDDIRAHGGGLRFKFRLKPDGVLFGWHIIRGVRIPGCDPKQNLTCFGTEISSPGGDFLDTRY